ncbi:MAG TPA: hypothetical protein VK826_19290, partial [Bacteroidia bacterium]|nr:hypothetical protein [Bacteroidia bacterium]
MGNFTRKLRLTDSSIRAHIFFFIVFGLFVKESGAQPLFQKTYGSAALDYGEVVRCTPDGYAVAGSTQSGANGSFDFFLIRTDSLGDTLWARKYGTAAQERLSCMEYTNDGGFILGGYANANMYLMKTSATGALMWSYQYAGNGFESITDIEPTSD